MMAPAIGNGMAIYMDDREIYKTGQHTRSTFSNRETKKAFA